MIKEMNGTKKGKTYKLFISHSWRYINALNDLRNLLDNNNKDFKAEYLEVTPDERINSMNEAYIRRRLSEKIGQADAMLVIGGIYASYSEWMQWELETAKKKGIPALYIAPWGQQHLSVVAKQNTDKLIRWNTNSIIKAIRESVDGKVPVQESPNRPTVKQAVFGSNFSSLFSYLNGGRL